MDLGPTKIKDLLNKKWLPNLNRERERKILELEYSREFREHLKLKEGRIYDEEFGLIGFGDFAQTLLSNLRGLLKNPQSLLRQCSQSLLITISAHHGQKKNENVIQRNI